MSEDLTGRRLGHYRVEDVLGRGGMSVLYRATDVRLGRKVALKVMGEHITGDSEFRERFVDEARNTSAIDHANVVPLYDFGEVDGMLYIAMRLVDGSDLASLLRDGPISAQRALDLLGQVAEALDLLHERGLVHLDLKPANVLVTSRETAGGESGPTGPGSEHAYLADFGLTRRGATGHRTTSGDFLGSPNYAAPEHLRGEPVDGRTDLYALTCMLFTCLAGRPPFQGQIPEVVQAHLRAEPPAVTSLVVLPRAVDDVLRRGMAKSPEERFADCRELVAAARAALAPASEPFPGRVSGSAHGPRAAGPVPSPRAHPLSPPQGQVSQGRAQPPGPAAPGLGVPGSGAKVPGAQGQGAQGQGAQGQGAQGQGAQGQGTQGQGTQGQGTQGPVAQEQGTQAGTHRPGTQHPQPFPPPPAFPQARRQQDDPVRLRPPMPAQSSSFQSSSFQSSSLRPSSFPARAGRAAVPLLVLAALSVVIVLLIVLLGGR